VAAEDAGISVEDMDNVFAKTRFTTCISEKLGGSGNPSVPTAHGVVCGMEAALAFLNPTSTLTGKSIAIQGCGNVGAPMIGMLLAKGVASIVACDADPAKVSATRELYKGDTRVRIVHASEIDILSEKVDIVSPCAYGGVLNGNTVPHIQAKIVCGAANNQLLDPSTDYGMHEAGRTLYCPDYVVNRMGIVNCANEQYGRVGCESMFDPLVARHLSREYEHSVFNSLLEVLEESKTRDISPAFAADQLANYKASQEHPLFGHRSQQIITDLVKGGWAG
jgi:glutamate dehydrogenase/leucine dehydrogenase